jgi:hypothetical protein
MSTLADRLGTEPQRTTVITECVELIDAQVKTKGFMVRSAYATVKALKRGIVRDVVDSMLDAWLARLQRHHDVATVPFSRYLVDHADEVAEDLLAVTDARAEKTSKATAKKLYLKMRDSAKRNVVEALPELGRMLDRHLATIPTTATA